MAKAIILATALRGTRRGRHSAISCCSCGNLRPRTLPCALAPPSGAAVSSRRRVCLVCRVLSVPSVWSVCLSVSWLRLLGTGCRRQSAPGERRALRVYPRSRKPRRGRRRAPSTAGSPALRCCLAQASPWHHGQEACNARFGLAAIPRARALAGLCLSQVGPWPCCHTRGPCLGWPAPSSSPSARVFPPWSAGFPRLPRPRAPRRQCAGSAVGQGVGEATNKALPMISVFAKGEATN